jgi:hypothetical protein
MAWPPFLTAVSNPADIPVMLHEIAVTGTSMAVASILTWGGVLAISHYMSKRALMKGLKTVETVTKPMIGPLTGQSIEESQALSSRALKLFMRHLCRSYED